MRGGALPLFGDAYLADTHHLSLEEHGAYLKLLMIAWRSDPFGLPDDDKLLARMLGIPGRRWSKLKPTVMAFWTLVEGRWIQARLAKERQFVDKKVRQNRASANARWSAETHVKPSKEGCERISERISERNAPPPPPTVTNVTGAEAPSDVVELDVVKSLWREGVELLVEADSSTSAARSLIGRWRKGHTDGDVLSAIRAAKTEGVVDPKAWITARLKAGGHEHSALWASAMRYANANN